MRKSFYFYPIDQNSINSPFVLAIISQNYMVLYFCHFNYFIMTVSISYNIHLCADYHN